jgi:hypothetical protein
MASRHFSFKSGKVGKGASHAKYVAGTGKYADRSDVLAVVDANLPKWAVDAADFFHAADQHERKNGRTYSEVEFAIPRECVDPVAFAKEYARQLLGEKHPYRLAVHDKDAADGGRNVHGHLMFTERKLDGHERTREQFFARANSTFPEKGGTAKDRQWNGKNVVQELRQQFTGYAQWWGIELDLRSNAKQGLGAPEPKLGAIHPRTAHIQTPEREILKQTVHSLRQERASDEHDRTAAFSRIGNRLAAASRAGAFSVSDHSSIAQEHRAIEAAGRGIEQAIAAKRHHEAAERVVAAAGRILAAAAPEIARIAAKAVAQATKPKAIAPIQPIQQAQRAAAPAAKGINTELTPRPKPPKQATEQATAAPRSSTPVEPPKQPLAAFLAAGTYRDKDGTEYRLAGRLKDGESIGGKVVAHVDMAEGKFTLVHVGRMAGWLVEGILAEVGQLVEGIQKAAGFDHKAPPTKGIQR